MNKEWYYDAYWEDGQTLKEIGDGLGVHAQTILNRMKKFGIPRRSSTSHSLKTIKKQSEVKLGEKNPMHGKKRPQHSKLMKKKMKGRKFSTETLQKMSNAKKGICGPHHNKWVHPDKRKGTLNKNIRRLSEMKQWRTAVFTRDDYTCQFCKDRGVFLHADHIKPLHLLIKECNIEKLSEAADEPKFWDIENGRTLCVECHKATKTFGAKIRKIDGFN